MYLKRVEIAGFKSFADRTELEFPKGVTAVVGPNGSGKSNIADAVRWVLGEQSAKSLRGAKMEDVIFAGSDSRRAVNFSEVSLTLDNSSNTLPIDYSEVTITRRLYRSGESEYYINRSQCRLKDITELFMDTGLGKEAYSIIGQGKIEEVLSNKSEERRGIFEEAAGIVKYKARKREAEKKLEETEANLLRVSDIIREIEEQIDPLHEQAKKAERYKELREELKNLEIGLYVYNIEQVHKRWRESQTNVKLLEEKQLRLSTEVNARDAKIEELRWRINRLDQEQEEKQERLLRIVEQLEKLEGDLKVLEERKKHANENRSSSAEKMERLMQKRELLSQQIAEQSAERDRLREQLHQLEEELRQEESRWEGINERLTTDLDQLKSEYIDLLGEIAAVRNEQKNAEQQRNILLQKRSRVEEEILSQIRKCDSLKAEVKKQEEELSKIAVQIEEILAKYRSRSQEHQAYKDQILKVAQLRRAKEQQKDQLGSRIEVLKEMQADFAGFNQGVKEILKARESLIKGIHGAVAELITVPAELETAVEIALGSALQHVVVEDEATGREAIAFLKKNNLGRATFLPISVMKSRRPSIADEKAIRQEAGILGLASDLISFSEKYRGVMENLLGSVVIAKELEIANRVARLTGYRYRIVTLDGDVVNPGGSMTGGTIKQKSSNLLSRGRAIEEVEKEWQRIQSEYNSLCQQEEELARQEREIVAQLDELRQAGEKLRHQEQEWKTALTRTQTEHKNQEHHMEFLKQEQFSLDEEIKLFDQQLLLVSEKLQKLEEDESELKAAIELADQNKKDQESSKEEMSAKITDFKIRIAKTKQMLDSKEEALMRLMNELKENDQERNEIDHEIKQLFSMLAENDYAEESFKKEIEAAREAKTRLTQEIEAKKQERAAIHQDMEQIENATKELRRNLRQVEEELHKEVVKENRFEVELDNLLEKLREEYEYTFEAAREQYPAPSDEEVTLVRQDVFRLKRDITSLGEVNLGAIEEYQRLKERLEFLTSQSEDLKVAKIALYQVIHEMDQEMKKRFMESFEQISHQFRIVFTQLFGGGRADLLLTEPDNLLETGIDIVAQPPGKKLQNLALLSGGERALTAIALLFAILRVRPVPFCVLDEVEAALDEANVSRFAKYLKEFSEQTQFIVITHRKGTMEGADVLYGVTMEGSGVSKLVSVKLEDYEKKSAGIA